MVCVLLNDTADSSSQASVASPWLGVFRPQASVVCHFVEPKSRW